MRLWSALADGRVTFVGDEEAAVQSSDRSKTYKVVWTKDKKAFGANDNASYWVGYMGYPILAAVLHLGLVKYDADIVGQFGDINWNKLNQIYKRRYDDVVEYVISQIEKSERGSSEQIKRHADEVFSTIKALKLGRINPPGDPPKRS
jgi:hypothetical protein